MMLIPEKRCVFLLFPRIDWPVTPSRLPLDHLPFREEGAMAMPTALAQREQTLALEAFRARVRTEVLAAIAEHKAALRDSALSADDYNKIRRLHDDKVARHKRTHMLTCACT